MNQEQLERIAYMAQVAKEAEIMLVIAPEAVLELLESLKAAVDLIAIREEQLNEERAEAKRLKRTYEPGPADWTRVTREDSGD
jgi:hypothetical protein